MTETSLREAERLANAVADSLSKDAYRDLVIDIAEALASAFKEGQHSVYLDRLISRTRGDT